MAPISVIVPARNAAARIGRQLEALAIQRSGSPFEVVVSDHGSIDATAAVAHSFADRFHRLVFVDAASAKGSAGVRNVGAAHATGSVLAFCDSDDASQPGWLDALVTPLEDRRGLVAGRVVRVVDGRPPPAGADAGRHRPRERTLGFLAFADTCNLAIRADDFRRLGGFDDSYVRCSDIEFSWRAQLSGLPLIDAPDAVMSKRVPPTGIELWHQHYAWARYRTRLYAQFRSAGMPRPFTRSLLTEYGRVVRSGLRFRTPAAARHFVVGSATAAGSLAGSLQWHVWVPWAL